MVFGSLHNDNTNGLFLFEVFDFLEKRIRLINAKKIYKSSALYAQSREMPSGSFWRCGDLGFRGGSTGYRILSTTAAVTKRHTKKRHDLTTSFASHFRGRVHLFFF